MDPSLYALHSVASNLDFDNGRMRRFLRDAGLSLYSRAEGVRELKEQTILTATEGP